MALFIGLTHASTGSFCLVEADSIRAIIPAGAKAEDGGCVFFKGDNAAKLLIKETPKEVMQKFPQIMGVGR